jgi:small subunit ribosomal protein S6
MSSTLGKLREYETLIAINPELGDDAVNSEVIDRLKTALAASGAELLREDRWGKKKLSFENGSHSRATYVLLHYVGQVAFGEDKKGLVTELERKLGDSEHVMRFLTTRVGEVSDLEARRAEVEKMVRERAADKARIDAERKEREDRAIDASGIV